MLAMPARAESNYIEYSTGTGFLVAADGSLLTSYHVVKECSETTVFTESTSTAATLIGFDEVHDLALFRTKLTHHRTAIFSDDPDQHAADAPLTLLGYPGNAWKTHRAIPGKARLLAKFGPAGEDHLLQISSSIARGNSGGPLFDRQGRVVGMITAKATLTHNNTVRHVDLAVQSSALLAFLRQHGIEPTISGDGPILANKEIIRRGRAQTVNLRCVVN